MPILFADELERLILPPAGRARTIFAPPGLLDGVRSALEDRAVESAGGFRLVAIRYDLVPPARALIDDAIDRLADAALALYSPENDDDNDNNNDAPLHRDVSIPWRKAARELLRQGKPPRPRGFLPALQAAQLAPLLDPSPLLLALVVHDEAPAPEALLGLARVAEWLANKTGARVVLVVPESLASSPALDSVNFDSTHVRAREPASVETGGGASSESRVSVSPLIGQPNPRSKGEMMLADRLERDPELAGLFQFNVHVPTVRGTNPLVDLAWEAGRVVVEVDGYFYHSNEAAFKNDRKRDYELLVSGWVVLRLPHDEVVADPDLAVDKIRDVAAFRRASQRLTPEHQR